MGREFESPRARHKFNLSRIMKNFLSILLIAVLSGCATKSAPSVQAPVPAPAAAAGKPAPSTFVSGAKITHVDTKLQFVVLDYRSRVLPLIGTRLTVYRAGQRVGEVQLTDPIRMGFATADIRTGDVRVGDEAR